MNSLPGRWGPWPRIGFQSLLILGLIGTSAPQLRLDPLPLGPGEIALFIWMGLSAALIASRFGRRWPIPEGFRAIGLFWFVAIPAVCLGFLMSGTMGPPENSGAGRDLVALGFVAVFALTLSMVLPSAEASRNLLRRFCFTTAFCLLALLIVALTLRRVGPFELWFQQVRFIGLTTNPNQLALFVATAPLVLAQLRQEDRSGNRKRYALAMGAIVIVGVATLSDALLLSWAATGAVAMVIAWARTVRYGHRKTAVIYALVVLLPLALVVLALVSGEQLYTKLEERMLDEMNVGAQASVRTTLWTHGMEAVARSPFVGWGSGAHSGLSGPFQATESHNTYVDWMTVSGVIGVAALLGLLGAALVSCLRARKPYLALAVLALALFSLFHYVLRQPVFWFSLVTILAWTSGRGDAAGAPRPRPEPQAQD